MELALFSQPPFPDYELIDSGAGEKLERLGRVTLRRPDPQALWKPARPASEWKRADLAFERESDRGGQWVPSRTCSPEARGSDAKWPCHFGGAQFWVRPTSFKHVGVFPEQAANWDFITRSAGEFGSEPRLLNLFGYTGVASVLAARAGYAVTHVDASKVAISWAVENAEASGLDRSSMRVICDDAIAFARREVRREKRYHGILLDPPHYGRGPKGEKWQFETGIAELVEACSKLLEDTGFMILSTYAIGYSPLAIRNLLADQERLAGGDLDVGELALAESGGRLLPAGYCGRFWRGFEPACS